MKTNLEVKKLKKRLDKEFLELHSMNDEKTMEIYDAFD